MTKFRLVFKSRTIQKTHLTSDDWTRTTRSKSKQFIAYIVWHVYLRLNLFRPRIRQVKRDNLSMRTVPLNSTCILFCRFEIYLVLLSSGWRDACFPSPFCPVLYIYIHDRTRVYEWYVFWKLNNSVLYIFENFFLIKLSNSNNFGPPSKVKQVNVEFEQGKYTTTIQHTTWPARRYR